MSSGGPGDENLASGDDEVSGDESQSEEEIQDTDSEDNEVPTGSPFLINPSRKKRTLDCKNAALLLYGCMTDKELALGDNINRMYCDMNRVNERLAHSSSTLPAVDPMGGKLSSVVDMFMTATSMFNSERYAVPYAPEDQEDYDKWAYRTLNSSMQTLNETLEESCMTMPSMQDELFEKLREGAAMAWDVSLAFQQNFNGYREELVDIKTMPFLSALLFADKQLVTRGGDDKNLYILVYGHRRLVNGELMVCDRCDRGLYGGQCFPDCNSDSD
jgi:hypothetical protein